MASSIGGIANLSSVLASAVNCISRLCRFMPMTVH
jgi:hypothetical protein